MGSALRTAAPFSVSAFLLYLALWLRESLNFIRSGSPTYGLDDDLRLGSEYLPSAILFALLTASIVAIWATAGALIANRRAQVRPLVALVAAILFQLVALASAWLTTWPDWMPWLIINLCAGPLVAAFGVTRGFGYTDRDA